MSKNLITYVDKSPIHGKGLFAKSFIAKDTIIGWLETIPFEKEGDYVLWLSEKKAVEVVCDLRFINHADQPNSCYYDDLSVVAIRDINPGEEITHNYDCREW
ncbi:MAG: SET domain-containing protein [Pseudomonadota bacterium]